MQKKWIVTGALLLTLALTGCGSTPQTNIEKEKQEAESQEQEIKEEDLVTVSYLTGLPATEEQRNKRPLAVMLNNIKEGCPQSGTEEASIIYECPVEGRITRLMGIFENYENMEKIGSIRSSRDYFVYFALEYDSLYAHFGQATPYVGELLNSNRVDNLSGAVAGIDVPATHSFYRTTDRKAPHNVYTSGEGILQDIDKLGYRTTLSENYKPKFTFNDGSEDTASLKDATVLYPGGKSNTEANGFSKVEARFEYHADDGLYYRFQYGDKHIDELTGNQLAVTNVIFQYCHGEVRDEKDYLAFGCHGDNGYKVQVFTGGKMTEGTWKRGGDTDIEPAQYLDANGNPIKLNPGKTWICIIWDEYGDDVVIE